MLTRLPDVEVKLYFALRESFAKDKRDGIHVTDLISPRQTFWKTVDPKPPTDRDLGYFTAGRGHEDAIGRFLAGHFVQAKAQEIDGIQLRPDFRSITDEIIPLGEYAEFKTRRSNLPATDAEANEQLGSYRDQIRGYMVLLARPRMYLVVLSLTEGKKYGDKFSESRPVFAVYVEEMDEGERAEAYRKITMTHALLLRSLEIKDHSILPLCRDWLCGKRVPVLPITCGGCGKLYQTLNGLQNHAREYKHSYDLKWEYISRCPWYDQCNPWTVDQARGV